MYKTFTMTKETVIPDVSIYKVGLANMANIFCPDIGNLI